MQHHTPNSTLQPLASIAVTSDASGSLSSSTAPVFANIDAGFHIIIPARLSSSRLPSKMLADLGGVPLVVRTAQQARKTQALSITVATDDENIATVVRAHGFHALMTAKDHPTGTDRLSQAASLLGLPDEAIVVNVQGDEPQIEPDLIALVARALADQPRCAMATAAHPISALTDAFNPNVVKVVCNAAGQALYFSRAPIPYARDATAQNEDGLMLAAYTPQATNHTTHNALLPVPLLPTLLRHIGIYAYRASFLKIYPQLSPSPIEQVESLEQLRVLWHGYAIAVARWSGAMCAGVDTAADLARVQKNFMTDSINPLQAT